MEPINGPATSFNKIFYRRKKNLSEKCKNLTARHSNPSLTISLLVSHRSHGQNIRNDL
jgi:hypothetical protein